MVQRQFGVWYGSMKREYRFAPPRRWRFDFAWLEPMVAVEVEGGIRNYGRHNRPEGFQGDCEKYNAAALDGWTVLRYTRDDLLKRPMGIVKEVKQALNQESWLLPIDNSKEKPKMVEQGVTR